MKDQKDNDDTSFEPMPVKSDEGEYTAARLHLALDQMRECLSGQLEFQVMRAQIMKRFYDELLSAGFTAEQALTITIAKGM
jgi:hypothetical protein